MTHRRDVEHRVVVGQRVVARVIAEGAFAARFALLDVPFDHDLGVGGDLQVDRVAPGQLDRRATQEAGEHELVDPRGKGGGRRVGHDRIRAEGDRHFETVARLAEVGRAVVVQMPMHAGGLTVVDLQAIHARVPPASRILRHDDGERDERTAVAGPSGEDWQTTEVRRIDGDVPPRGPLHDGRGERRQLTQLAERPDLAHQPRRHLEIDESRDARRQFVERCSQGQFQPSVRPQLVHEHRDDRTGKPRSARALALAVHRPLGPLKQQGGASRLARAVGDLGHLEIGIDLGTHTDELALAFQ